MFVQNALAHFQWEYTCCSVMMHIHCHTSSSCCNTESLLKPCSVPAAVAECITTHANTSFSVLFQYKELLGRSCLTLRPAAWAGSRPALTPELLHHTLTHFCDILLSCHCVFSKDSHAFLYDFDEYFIDIVLHWWIAYYVMFDELMILDVEC